MAWEEPLRRMKVLLVLRRDNQIELYSSSLPSAPPRGMPVEQQEYSSEPEGSDRLETIPKVSPTSVSDASSSGGWAVRTVMSLACSIDPFVIEGSTPRN